jgi:hypothetical protein
MEFRVIVDKPRNGEASIRDELTVCRWEGAWIGGNYKLVVHLNKYYLFFVIFKYKYLYFIQLN